MDFEDEGRGEQESGVVAQPTRRLPGFAQILPIDYTDLAFGKG